MDGNILVVDDIPANLLAIEAALEPLSQRIVTVTSGAEALGKLLDGDFAVALLDVQMPEMDGYETARWIRLYCFDVNVTGRLRGAKRAESGACSAWRANVGASANAITPRGALLARGGTSGYEHSQGVVDGRPAIAWGESRLALRCARGDCLPELGTTTGSRATHVVRLPDNAQSRNGVRVSDTVL